MPFPLLAAALPYAGYGLMGLSALVGSGLYIHSNRLQNKITRREELFARRQASDYDRWMSDYRRNTGLEPRYPYLGIPGQSRYYSDVRLPSFSDLYGVQSSNMWSSAAHGAFGAAMSGSFAYNRWRNSGYRPSKIYDVGRDPSYL